MSAKESADAVRAGVRLVLKGALQTDRTGLCTAETEIGNRQQRPAPETRPTRTEIPEIADQRLGHPSLTCGKRRALWG